jgi:hypothetical protein
MERRGRSLAAAANVVLIGLQGVIGFALVGLTVGAAVVGATPDVTERLQAGLGSDAPTKSEVLVLLAILLGLLAMVFALLRELRSVVRTVKSGEPFHPANPRRLRMVALWLALIEIATTILAFMIPRAFLDRPPGDDIDLTSWLAVLIVLVLAEVFHEGARLRADAELTV